MYCGVQMTTALDRSMGINQRLIEKQIRFMLATQVSIPAVCGVMQAENIPRCSALSSARGSKWAKNNLVVNAILRIEMVQRGGKSATAGRRKKYLHFRYNGEIYIPEWQFAKDGKLLPLVKKLVELYQKGSSDDRDGSPPINKAWSNFYVVSRVEDAIRIYKVNRSPRSRKECAKQLIQRTKWTLEPGGW
jgi:hypothetical protein